MNTFDEYAFMYDRAGQSAFSEEMAAQVLGWLASQGWETGSHQGRRVLDLACGTGAAALVFAAAGCSVVGLDRSNAMLQQAQLKIAPEYDQSIQFVQGDIRHIIMDTEQLAIAQGSNALPDPALLAPNTFDLITCFNSISYLVEDGDLQLVCADAANLLRPGGFFVFDRPTEAEFATWDELDQVLLDAPDALVYQRLNYDARHRLGLRHIGWFTHANERWWRNEENLAERAWRNQEVRTALSHPASALEIVAQLTPTGTTAVTNDLRVVYYARKREA